MSSTKAYAGSVCSAFMYNFSLDAVDWAMC